MKLFKILVTHIAPKNYKTAVKEYIIAPTHKDVFDYLMEEADYTLWRDLEWTEDEKCDVLFGHGESALDTDKGDAYYGISEYNWEQIKDELTNEEIKTLVVCNIANVFKGK